MSNNKEYLFVYGQFRDFAKPLLKDAIFCEKAEAHGKIYKVNEFYPGFDSTKTGRVVGDIYLVDPTIFPELDEYEGEEFIRNKIMISNKSCWIYEYKYDTSKFDEIRGGDWWLR